MPDQLTAHIARILLVSALLFPLCAHAQSEPLYQVELLVFSQPAGGAAEHWEATPELAYPGRSRFLIYPGEQSAPAAELAATAIPDATAPAVGNTLPPTAYATLPSEQRLFSGKAAAMQRSGRYRILFHEAWIQPMHSQAEALPIVLDRSGDGGAWPALQGTIKLYLSRYFYLETNLWLNTQGEYLQGVWRMPAPPLAPMSSARQNALPTGSAAPRQPGASAPGNPDFQPAVAGAQSPTLMNDAAQGPDYPFRHAVLLQQTRRMRSDEIVYVDHPLLGVLIRISPLAAQGEGPVAEPRIETAPIQ
jgi:hypothetical protein